MLERMYVELESLLCGELASMDTFSVTRYHYHSHHHCCYPYLIGISSCDGWAAKNSNHFVVIMGHGVLNMWEDPKAI